MENLIQRLRNKTNRTVIALGLAGLITGCDERRDIVLKEMKVDGPVEIQIIRKELPGDSDRYKLEVYQSGRLVARLETTEYLFSAYTILTDEDFKTYQAVGESFGYKKKQDK